jgi:hypothetical protein
LGGVTLLGTRPVRPAALLNASVSEELLHIRMFFCVLKCQSRWTCIQAQNNVLVRLFPFVSFCSHAKEYHFLWFANGLLFEKKVLAKMLKFIPPLQWPE